MVLPLSGLAVAIATSRQVSEPRLSRPGQRMPGVRAFSELWAPSPLTALWSA
jgi:hypothetical protein